MNIDILKLKSLISDYEEEKSKYDEMVRMWEKYDDPGSDPGLQFSQGEIVGNAMAELEDYIKSLNK